MDAGRLQKILEEHSAWVSSAAAEGRSAHLVGQDLGKADLRGAEMWRCNIRGCVIAADVLHAVLACREPKK